MSAICGEVLVFDQSAGPPIQLRTFGDEFYARYETLGGYSVVYDVDRGLYCYAELRQGHFVSSRTPTTKRAPIGLPRHLKEDRQVRNDKFEARYREYRPRELAPPSHVSRTVGPNNGLLDGRQVAHGAVKGLTILVEFDDHQTTITSDEVAAMLNAPDFGRHGNHCSVRRYYDLMSSGKLDYTNRVVGPVRLGRRRSYYINNLLIHEALELAIQQYGLDLSEFDSRNEGIVDALSIMYAGRTQYSGHLWPHNHVVGLSHGGIRTHYYTIQSLGRRNVDMSIGTFAHESGHMLCRWPDLYDYGQRDGDFEESSGLGLYCLMSSGNHLNGGKTPAPVCSYLRDLIGWCDHQVSLNSAMTFEAVHGDYGTCLRFDTSKPHEYFLVENRGRTGLDAYLPDEGLAVYHCDTRGSNEYQDGTPDNHYQCALLQADGRHDLEMNVNTGDSGDLYDDVPTTALDGETVPDSRTWDGADSGLRIAQVGRVGDRIAFRTGTEVADRVQVAAVADLLIPDDTEEGVASALVVGATGTLKALRVTVDITHSYRGDLNVQLVTPSQKRVVLHTKRADPQADLHLDLSSGDFEPLRDLAGEPIQGTWTLEVRDLWEDDQGRLDRWALELELEPRGAVARKEVEAALDIPDAAAQGVTSELVFEDGDPVEDLRVEVDVSHTYRGDLELELIAPGGQRAALRQSNDDHRPDLRAAYDAETTPSLRSLRGVGSAGTWKLHVRDVVAEDTGVLNRWALEIRR